MSTKEKNSHFKFMLIVILFWFAQYIYVPYQTPFLTTQAVTQNIIGLVIGSYGLAQLLLRVPIGIIADKGINHKIIISSGILLAGVASAIRIISPTGIGFLLANILSGVASATWISFMVYYLNKFNMTLHFKATSQLIMANNLGMLLGFITSSLLFNNFGMRFICFLSLLSGILGFILSHSISSENEKIEITPFSLAQVGGLFKNKHLLIYGGLALVQQGIQMSTTMSFTTQIIQKMGANNFFIGFSTIFYMLCAVIFAKIGTISFIHKINKHHLIYISFFLLGMYCLLVPNVHHIFFVLLLQIIPGFATGILFSLITSEAIQSVPASFASTGMGIYQAIYAIGMTIFPIITGWINTHYTIEIAFIFLSILAFLTGFLYFLIVKIWFK